MLNHNQFAFGKSSQETPFFSLPSLNTEQANRIN